MRKIILTGLLLAFSTVVVLAQITTGSVYGTLKTPEGLVVAGATVTLSAEFLADMATTTNERGNFRFGELPVGRYTLTFELEGYQKVIKEGVAVRLAASTRLAVSMAPSEMEAVITVTGEAVIVNLKKTGTGSQFTQEMLSNIPTARDPWVIMDQVAGLQVDRVNVGGTESGQQSNFVSHGSNRGSAMWNVDGVTITDAAAIGASPTYYDYDAFEEMQVITGGADASIQTGGASLNFITKQGGDTFHGQASFYVTGQQVAGGIGGPWQATNMPQDLVDAGLSGNKIDSIKDYGFDIGGPVLEGKLWFWGSYGIQDIKLRAVTGALDATLLENWNLKFTGQLSDKLRWTGFWTVGDKIKDGRGAGARRPPETTWDQSGPTNIYKIEATYLLSDSTIVTGRFAYVEGGFMLEPKGGRDTMVTYEYSTGAYGGSYYFYETVRPQYQTTITGEHFIDEAFGGSHEIKAGFEYRHTPVTSQTGWGGNMVMAYWQGTPSAAWIDGWGKYNYITQRTSVYVMDVISKDKLTLNFGVRYDRQWGNNRPSGTKANKWFPNIIQAVDGPDMPKDFTWNDIVPRLGATYALNDDGTFIARANFSMYADQIGIGNVGYTNPAGWRELDFQWTDVNNDGTVQENELGALWWWNFNPNAVDPLDTGRSIDSDIKAPRTIEAIIGLEKEVIKDLSVSVNGIWRKLDRFNWAPENGWSSADYFLAGTATGNGFSGTYYDSNKAHTYEYTRQPQPDYNRSYKAIEIEVHKRLSNKWMANLSFNFHDNIQNYESAASYLNPTNVDRYNGYYYAPQTSGSGKSNIFIGAKWSFKGSGMYQMPYGFNVSGYASYKQGNAYPIRLRSPVLNIGGRLYPLGVNMGDERLDDLFLLDLRAEKVFQISDSHRFTIMADIFNVLNTDTIIGQNRDAYASAFGDVEEIVNPRLFRLGFRFQF